MEAELIKFDETRAELVQEAQIITESHIQESSEQFVSTTTQITSQITSEKTLRQSTEVINVEAQTIGGVERFVETQVQQEANNLISGEQVVLPSSPPDENELNFATPPAMSPVVSLSSELDQTGFLNQSLPGSGIVSSNDYFQTPPEGPSPVQSSIDMEMPHPQDFTNYNLEHAQSGNIYHSAAGSQISSQANMQEYTNKI